MVSAAALTHPSVVRGFKISVCIELVYEIRACVELEYKIPKRDNIDDLIGVLVYKIHTHRLPVVCVRISRSALWWWNSDAKFGQEVTAKLIATGQFEHTAVHC